VSSRHIFSHRTGRILLTLLLTSSILWKIRKEGWRMVHGIERQPLVLQQPVHVLPELKQLM
jgi:hypothetical protein